MRRRRVHVHSRGGIFIFGPPTPPAVVSRCVMQWLVYGSIGAWYYNMLTIAPMCSTVAAGPVYDGNDGTYDYYVLTVAGPQSTCPGSDFDCVAEWPDWNQQPTWVPT